MNHPTHEQLLSYLEGNQPDLCEHIENCAQCAAELAGWKKTVRDLERFDWPHTGKTESIWCSEKWKWAAAVAAMVLLWLGFAFGRLTVSSQSREKVVAEIRREVGDQLRADLLAAATSDNQQPLTPFQAKMRAKFEVLASLSNGEKLGALEDFARSLQQKQDADQKSLLALLAQSQQQHEADYISLRRDLETVAATADTDLKQNRQRLSELAQNLQRGQN